jgi:hypothetical protein
MNEKNPLELLQEEIPSDVLSKTIDDVMIDYSIASILEQQSSPPQKAAEQVRLLRRLRDAFSNQNNK